MGCVFFVRPARACHALEVSSSLEQQDAADLVALNYESTVFMTKIALGDASAGMISRKRGAIINTSSARRAASPTSFSRLLSTSFSFVSPIWSRSISVLKKIHGDRALCVRALSRKSLTSTLVSRPLSSKFGIPSSWLSGTGSRHDHLAAARGVLGREGRHRHVLQVARRRVLKTPRPRHVRRRDSGGSLSSSERAARLLSKPDYARLA